MFYAVIIDRHEGSEIRSKHFLKSSAHASMMDIWLNERKEWIKAKVINVLTAKEIYSIKPDSGIEHL